MPFPGIRESTSLAPAGLYCVLCPQRCHIFPPWWANRVTITCALQQHPLIMDVPLPERAREGGGEDFCWNWQLISCWQVSSSTDFPLQLAEPTWTKEIWGIKWGRRNSRSREVPWGSPLTTLPASLRGPSLRLD